MPPTISFTEKPTLEGELVVLRPVRTGDAPQLAAEGTKRQALLWEGTWVDAQLMAMLAAEWSQHRGHHSSRSVPPREGDPQS